MMSKKQVLAETGISYGQFYRWKRKGLIPERWIVRKSTYTGHETFLPREKIVERILRIKRLKKSNKLDEIAELLSPELTQKKYTLQEVEDFPWIGPGTLELFGDLTEGKSTFSFRDVLGVKFVESAKDTLAECEIRKALKMLIDQDDRDFDVHLLVARQECGEKNSFSTYGCERSFCIISDGRVRFDPSVEVLAEVYVADLVREIKVSLNRPN